MKNFKTFVIMMIYSWKPLIGQDIYLIISLDVMELEVVVDRPVVNQNSKGAIKLGYFCDLNFQIFLICCLIYYFHVLLSYYMDGISSDA